MNPNNNLHHKIYQGARITPEEALELFSWDIIDLGNAGNMRRKLAFPRETVGFIIDMPGQILLSPMK